MRGLDLRKFRKVSADDDFTTLKHYAGHEIRIYHKKLSKAHRAAMDAIPMAKGGEVKKKDKGPYIDPKAAKEIEAGAMGRKPKTTEQRKDHISASITESGVASPDPDMPKDFKRQREEFNKKLAPEGMAEGGVAEEKIEDIEYTSLPTEVRPVVQGPPVEMPPAAPGLAQTAGHYIGDSLREGVGATVDAFKNVGSAIVDNPVTRNIGEGIQGITQGASGQPLKAIPSVEEAMREPQQAPLPAQEPQPKQQAASQAAAPSPATPASQGDSLLKAFDQQAKEQAKILQQAEAEKAQLAYNYKQDYDRLKATRDAVFQEYKEGKIDPNNYWNSKDTGSKVATIIGLLVSGFSGSDQASKFVDDQITRDIDAQKANLGKKQSLLEFNLKEFGNLRDATEMTRLMQMDKIKDQLSMAAAKVGDPVQKAKLLEDVTRYDMMIQDRAQKTAAARAISQAMTTAKQDPSKAAAVTDAVSQFDPKAGEELRGRLVPGMGFANTPQGAIKVADAVANNEKTQGGIKRLLEINKMPSKNWNPTLWAEASTIQAEMMGPLRSVMGLGTLSEGDKKLLESMVKDPTAWTSLSSSNKASLETLSKRMNDTVRSVAKVNGIEVPEIKTMGGSQYRKVPGGWQKVQ